MKDIFAGWEFVTAGYGIVFLSLFVYSLWLLWRAKKLSEQVPEEKRRFLEQ